MAEQYRAVIPSPLPEDVRLALHFSGDALAAIDFVEKTFPCFVEPHPAVLAAMEALKIYFSDPLQQVFPPLELVGTPYQQRVWQSLCAIPCGQTLSYGELAQQLGSSARAVANACRANPVPLLIPCHRVVAAHGLGGYMGQTEGHALAIKRWLLQHEQHAG